jgi:hypothetical protein
MSRGARIATLAVLATAAVVLFIVLSGSDDDSDSGTEDAGTTATQTEPQAPAFEVVELREGEPVGGVGRFEYTRGDRIRIEVRSDVRQEDIHIHGYDQEQLNPPRTARFDFPATQDGIYELEAHGPSGDVVLAEIVVNPG